MQEFVVFFLVALAAGYLARQAWLSWCGKKSCCESGCGKTHKPSSTQLPDHLVKISVNGKTLPVRSPGDEQNSSLN
jgi:hypothetical protein